MKKILVAIMTLVLALSLLASCSGSSNQGGSSDSSTEESAAEEPSTPEPKTIGEAITAGLDGEVFSYSYGEDYIKVVNDDYVCEATMTPEVYEKLEEVDFFAEDKDAQYAEILSELAVEKVELRSESQLTEEEKAALIGKKGKELQDLGFENYGYSLSPEQAIFIMDRNGYTYNVEVEEIYEDSDDFDSTEVFAESTIKGFED